MKRKSSIFISAMLVMALFPSAYARSVDIYVNGKAIAIRGEIEEDTTFVPMRAVSEALGASVDWDGENVLITQSEDDVVSNLIGQVSESVVAVAGNYKTSGGYSEYTAHGSGVVIKSNGTILTNAHVVKDISNITVVFHNGTSYGAIVQYMDEESDLAIIKIDKLGLKPLNIAQKDRIITGRTVIAIGTPLSLNMHNSATKGIISGKDVSVPGATYPLIQTDAAINGGNSGGALVDLQGNLVGINSSKYAGVGIEGIAFAIPVETINYVVSQYEKNRCVIRPQVKVTFEESWEARIGLPTTKGITVRNSASESLQDGDVVTRVNGAEIHSIIDYNRAIRDTFTDKLEFTVLRNGTEQIVQVDYTLE